MTGLHELGASQRYLCRRLLRRCARVEHAPDEVLAGNLVARAKAQEFQFRSFPLIPAVLREQLLLLVPVALKTCFLQETLKARVGRQGFSPAPYLGREFLVVRPETIIDHTPFASAQVRLGRVK